EPVFSGIDWVRLCFLPARARRDGPDSGRDRFAEWNSSVQSYRRAVVLSGLLRGGYLPGEPEADTEPRSSMGSSRSLHGALRPSKRVAAAGGEPARQADRPSSEGPVGAGQFTGSARSRHGGLPL